LVTAPGQNDPLTQARLTVTGRLTTTDDADARRDYLAKHPAAEQYVEFADFGFWRLEIEAGHWVGGFGRILPLRRDDLISLV
jgi:putative heme iron utilization protein